MVCVVAPQIVEYNWYWNRFWLYSQFLIARTVRGSAETACDVVMIFDRISVD